MALTLDSQLSGEVVVIRCRGRVTAGAEVTALQQEVEKQIRVPGTTYLAIKQVVLQLAEADYIDSSGLGALVHLLSVLRSAGGELRLCELSPSVLRVLELTNLRSLFAIYGSEREAIEGFTHGRRVAGNAGPARTRVVCVDTSKHLLAYVEAVLKRSDYEVFTTVRLGEAVALVSATKPRVVVCGPGLLAMPTGEDAVERFRRCGPNVQVLRLPVDFSTSDAGEAGVDLVGQVQALVER